MLFKVLLTLSGLFLFLTSVPAQDFVWQRQNPSTTLEKLQDVHIDETGFGYLVAENGLIQRTEDYGFSWTIQETDFVTNLLHLTVFPGTNGQVVIAGGSKVARTTDGGQTWTEGITGISTGAYNDMLAVSETDAFIIANTGQILKSTDAGLTWAELSLPISPEWKSIDFVDAQTGWVSGINGEVLFTDDGGTNWEMLPANDFSGTNTELLFMDANTGYAISNKSFYQTDDGGMSWELVGDNVFQSGFIKKLSLVDETTFVATLGNSIWVSTDEGVTWIKTTPFEYGSRLEATYALPDGQIWVTGDLHTLAFSNDYGATWVDLFEDEKRTFNFIGFLDENFGLAAGEKEVVWKTFDGGETWEPIEPPLDINRLYDAVIISETEYFFLEYNRVFHTTDGGQTWEEALGSVGNFLTSLTQSDDGTLYATHFGNGLYRSTDLGQTWENLTLPGNPGFLDVAVWENDLIVAAGPVGTLYQSPDGGQTWNSAITDTPKNLGEVFFSDANTVWATAENPVDTIWKSEDAGLTWEKQQLPLFTSYRDIFFTTPEIGWLVGNTVVYKTTDGGATWESDLDIATIAQSVFAPTPGSELAYIAGNGGLIAKYGPAPIINGTTQVVTQALHLFPNPGKGQLNLEIPALPAELKIWNANGQLIWTRAINERQASLDVSNLPAGLYLLQLRTADDVYSAKYLLQP